MAPNFGTLPCCSTSVFASSLLLFVLALRNAASIENYSSSVKLLEKLATSDIKIARVLYRRQEKIPASSKLRTKVNSFLEHFEEGTGLMGQVHDWKEWAANLTKKDITKLSRKTAKGPMSAYKLIHRQFFQIKELRWNTQYFDLSSLAMDSPESGDVKDTVEGLLRLQQIHELKTLDMAAGLIAGISTKVKLNGPDCFTIGDFAQELEFWALSVEWLTLWNLKLQQEQEETGSKVKFLLQEAETKLLQVAYTHDDRLSNEPENVTLFATSLNLTSDKIVGFAKNLQFSTRQTTKMARRHKNKLHYRYSYWAICQGQRLQTEKERSQLFCFLEGHVHPYFLIGPLKSEVIARQPVILRYYDVVGPGLRKKLAKYSGTNRSLTVNRVTEPAFSVPVFEEGQLFSTDFSLLPGLKISKRVHPPTFLRFVVTNMDEQNETLGLPRFTRTIEMLTGLDLDLKVGHLLPYYTSNFAGQLEPHMDKANEETENISGMRIATFMTYMNNVEAGGETVFPFAGVGVKPVKGSALFWFNVRRNGLELDDWALHGACPPIIGQKVVATRWIFYNAQFQNFKCGLNQNDEFDWNFFQQKYKSLHSLVKN